MRQTFTFQRQVNDVDAIHFFLGQRSRSNVAMTMVGVLASDDVSFLDAQTLLDDTTEEVLRWQDYLRPAPFNLAAPTWTPRPLFRIEDYVGEQRLPPGATWREVWNKVDELQSTPFVEGRPPWQIVVLRGAPEGRALLLIKVHHSFSDGSALSLMFGKVFMRKALAEADIELAVDNAAPPAGIMHEAIRERRRAISEWIGYLRQHGPRTVSDSRWRRQEIDGFRAYGRRGKLWPTEPVSSARRVAAFRVPLEPWREEAKKRGGGVNDLFLALVAKTMRAYLSDRDLDAAPLRVVMPVSLRPEEGAQDGGNVVGVGILSLHGRTSELSDLEHVNAESSRAKAAAEDARPTLADATLRLLPGAIRARLAFRRFAASDVLATSMVMPIAGELCGTDFEMVFMTAPVIGTPASFSLATYDGHLHLATNIDMGLVVDPDRLEGCILDTLVAVFGSDSVQALRQPVYASTGAY
jgi:WS/DGAT/MGAT family acyltransferase